MIARHSSDCSIVKSYGASGRWTISVGLCGTISDSNECLPRMPISKCLVIRRKI
jgi:hypothetical protein